MPAAEIANYFAMLESSGIKVKKLIKPGKQVGTAFKKHPEITIPPELEQMWLIFDGQKQDSDKVIEGFALLSIKDSLEHYQICLDLALEDFGPDDHWPQGFVPIGNSEGDYLLVNCRKGSPTYGAVYELGETDGVGRSAASIAALFGFHAELFKRRLSRWEADYGVQLDLDRYDEFEAIGRQMNPGCDHFDPNMEPASESKDWLPETQRPKA